MFSTKIMKHLVSYGLGTIAWLPDSVDSTKMSCVVREHSRFNVDTAIQQRKMIASKYDSYDKSNDDDAKTFLENSLSDDLAKDLSYLTSEEDTTFAVMYLRLIHLVLDTSIDRFETLRTNLKGLKPSQFPGQNLLKMGQRVRELSQELETAGQYDHNLNKDNKEEAREDGVIPEEGENDNEEDISNGDETNISDGVEATGGLDGTGSIGSNEAQDNDDDDDNATTTSRLTTTSMILPPGQLAQLSREELQDQARLRVQQQLDAQKRKSRQKGAFRRKKSNKSYCKGKRVFHDIGLQ